MPRSGRRPCTRIPIFPRLSPTLIGWFSLLHQNISTHRFSTRKYDPAIRTLRYVSAAHNAPIVIRWKIGQCEVFRLEPSGTALGLLESSHFASQAFQLEKDDLFVAYTDGITESEDACGEPWGQEGLEALLRACRDRTPRQIVRRILDEISALIEDPGGRHDSDGTSCER